MRFTIAVCLVLLSCAGHSARPEKPVSVVADLRYGTALYEYFEGNYRAALTELLLAESRGGIAGHGERPKVMKGSFSLAYGMDQRAAEIFDDVLSRSEEPETRDAAWYYLAQMRYLRQNWDGTADALARISNEPPQRFRQELMALRVNLAIQQGDLNKAAELLEREELSESWLPYLYYNLGAAYSRAGDYQAAIPLYNRVADMPLHTEQARGLYDRAMTAAGYSYLHNQQYAEAQAQFSRVRLHSPLSSDALLGLGWAAAQQDSFLEALAPWQQLAGQSLADENAQEALVAVPYAYERLGHRGEAVKQFQRAQERLLRESQLVEGAIEAVAADNAVVEALQAQKDEEFNWIDAASHEQLEPQLVYLADLFSRNSFQGQLRELRDLVEIRTNLLDWQEKLALYNDMIDQREAARERRAQYLEELNVREQIETLREQRDQLTEELLRVRQEQDYLALADDNLRELQERSDRAAANIEKLRQAGEDVEAYEEKQRRYAGLLLWEAADDFAARVWEAQRQLSELNQQLQTLEQVQARVESLIHSGRDLVPYRERLGTGQERIDEQLERTENLIAAAERQLQGEMLAELREQHERLQYYLTQSRLAVARLYDSAKETP